MKRLTISMSDELFSKLDSIENKSLFIRKLIERELNMLDSIHDIDSSIPWEQDIETLKGNVDEIYNKLSCIEKQLNERIIPEIPGPETQPCPALTSHRVQHTADITANSPEILEPAMHAHVEEIPAAFNNEYIEIQSEIPEESASKVPEQAQEDKYSFLIPENTPLEPQLSTLNESEAEVIPALLETEKGFDPIPEDSMPEITPADATIEDTPTAMPDLDQQAGNQKEQATATPEFEAPTEIPQKQAIEIPEFEQPPETKQRQVWTMPLELETPAEAQQEQTFTIPEFEKPVETRQEQAFVMPEFETLVEEKQEQAVVMPEFESPVETKQEQPFVMPESVETQQQAVVMPEFEPSAGTQQEQTLTMPELTPPVDMTDDKPGPFSNPPFEIARNESFVMPELSAPEGAVQTPPFMAEMKAAPENNNQPFAMPDLKPPALTGEAENFKLPELKTESTPSPGTAEQHSAPAIQKQPLFKLHSIDSPQQEEKQPPFIVPAFDTQPENMQAPPFENPQPDVNQPVQQLPMSQPVGNKTADAPARNSSSKPDKLGSNILMYMPHGAKVKKDIIKSLISKQFTESEIEAKISEMVSSGMLKLAAEEGTQYLIRP